MSSIPQLYLVIQSSLYMCLLSFPPKKKNQLTLGTLTLLTMDDDRPVFDKVLRKQATGMVFDMFLGFCTCISCSENTWKWSVVTCYLENTLRLCIVCATTEKTRKGVLILITPTECNLDQWMPCCSGWQHRQRKTTQGILKYLSSMFPRVSYIVLIKATPPGVRKGNRARENPFCVRWFKLGMTIASAAFRHLARDCLPGVAMCLQTGVVWSYYRHKIST